MRGVCIGAQPFFLSWRVPIRTHAPRRRRRPMNRFKMFILCFSPETPLLVSHSWEHPLGRPCSDTRFLMPALSGGAPALSGGAALAPSTRRACRRALWAASLQQGTSLRAAVSTLAKHWIQDRPQSQPPVLQDLVHILPEPHFKGNSRTCLRCGADLWST